MEEYLKQHSQLWLVVLCVAAFLVTYLAPVDASFSDPAGALLTAQAIVEHRTIRLDTYVNDPRFRYNPIPQAANGGFYDYFPIGTPMLTAPAVFLARLRGLDMIYPEDNRALQNSLSAITVVVCALLIFAICRLYLRLPQSFFLTVVFTFGSSTVSTLGTALWSSNLALVLGLATVLILGRVDRGIDNRPPEAVLGALMFLAYLCRPTMALLIPFVIMYVGQRARRVPLKLLTTVVAGLGLFMLFSWREYGLLVPPYYQPSRLGDTRFLQAMVGHIVSPSRGILVGSPYLLLTLTGLLMWLPKLRKQRLVWLAIGWIGCHWVMVSSFHHWWGGWSFGNRLFVDVLPALLVLTIVVFQESERRLSPRSLRVARLLLFTTATFAVFVHTHQGLFNVYTVMWSDGIDRDESRIFDWRHPQFLASPSMLGVNQPVHRLLAMRSHFVGESIVPTSPDVVFDGWSVAEGGGLWRWSNSRNPKILLRVGETRSRSEKLFLEIEAGTYEFQQISVRVNGIAVGRISSERTWVPSTYEFLIPASAVASARAMLPGARIFEIEFDIPGASSVGEGSNQRLLGVCLRRFLFKNGGRSQS